MNILFLYLQLQKSCCILFKIRYYRPVQFMSYNSSIASGILLALNSSCRSSTFRKSSVAVAQAPHILLLLPFLLSLSISSMFYILLVSQEKTKFRCTLHHWACRIWMGVECSVVASKKSFETAFGR